MGNKISAAQIEQLQAYTWAVGKNLKGELGIGKKKDVLLPTLLKTKASNISASDDTVGVVTESGILKIAGSNLHGRLGLEKINVTIKISLNPVQLEQKIKQVCCGQLHTLALSVGGQLFSWGGSYRGKQGERKQVKELPKPMLIEALKDTKVSQIGTGRYFSAALSEEGVLFTWGCGENGQLGHGTLQDVEKPQRIKAFAQKIKLFQCGWEHMLALTHTNQLFSWGLATMGRLGLGDKVNSTQALPLQVHFQQAQDTKEANSLNLSILNELNDFLTEVSIKKIQASNEFSMLLTQEGRIVVFGSNQQGQLGLKGSKVRFSPEFVADAPPDIIDIACGDHHSVLVTGEGHVFVSGLNDHGQLGLGDKQTRKEFVRMDSVMNLNVAKAYCGLNTTYLVLDETKPTQASKQPQSPDLGRNSNRTADLDREQMEKLEREFDQGLDD